MDVLDWSTNIREAQDNREVANFNKEYVDQMLEYWEENLPNIFRRQKDILVADAVLEMFRRRENIENFNKKALYILIREMTGSKTQHITRIVNVMKKYNMNLMQEFQNTGQLDTANTGSFL
jgi:predicted RNA-binding protein